MDSEALFEELKDLIRLQDANALAEMRAKEAAVAHLSDNEWLAHRVSGNTENLSQKDRQFYLRLRNIDACYPKDGEARVDSEAHRILPDLVAVRGETEGPITDEQMHLANLKGIKDSHTWQNGLYRERALAVQDPTLRSELVELAKAFEATNDDLYSLICQGHNGDQWDEVVKRQTSIDRKFTRKFNRSKANST